ncbi:HTH_Tnp_Tc3_2 domain-containing protein [Trichonephila clavipes]|nr:HTH_Tnp_Tc3_2 domain-containing protein [Trichonephila clavipes]
MLVHILRDSPNNVFKGYDVLPWPARSPDLSPIEHVCDALGRQLQPSRDTGELTAQMQRLWQDLPQGVITTLGSIPIRRFCVQNTCSRPTRATTPAEDRFLALSARRRRTTTVPQLVADHFLHQEEESPLLWCEIVFTMQVCMQEDPVVCVPLNGRQRRNRLCWAREHVSWTQQQWASVPVHRRVQIYNGE